MNRQKKQLVIDTLKENFSNSQATFLVNVQGLTVVQTQSLRKDLRECGGVMKVAKNTLLNLAVKGIDGAEDLCPHFSNQIAVVFAPEDSPGVAKAIYDVSKANGKLKIVVGCLEGSLIDADKVQFLAKLPPRNQLLAQLCGVLNAPIRAHVYLLTQVMREFVWVIKQVAEKQEQQ